MERIVIEVTCANGRRFLHPDRDESYKTKNKEKKGPIDGIEKLQHILYTRPASFETFVQQALKHSFLSFELRCCDRRLRRPQLVRCKSALEQDQIVDHPPNLEEKDAVRNNTKNL